MSLTQIRTLLSTLSKTEMSQLKVEVDFLSSKSGKFLSPDQQLLYRNIIGGLSRRHIRYMPFNEAENYKPRLHGYDHDAFLSAFDAIEIFIFDNLIAGQKDSSFPGAMRHQFYSILVQCTISSLTNVGKPAGIVSVLKALNDPDGIMDYAFPSYVRAGILRSILG